MSTVDSSPLFKSKYSFIGSANFTRHWGHVGDLSLHVTML